jgi:hypothetical protein
VSTPRQLSAGIPHPSQQYHPREESQYDIHDPRALDIRVEFKNQVKQIL